MIVAMVEAMPFGVKVALYGAGVAGELVEQVLPDRHRQLARR